MLVLSCLIVPSTAITQIPSITTKTYLKSQNISLSKTNQNDAGSGTDAPHNITGAITVSLNDTFYGTIGEDYRDANNNTDESDTYEITLPAEGYLAIETAFNTLNLTHDSNYDIKITNHENRLVMDRYVKTDRYKMNPSIKNFEVPIGFGSKYYVQIESSYNYNYSINLSFQSTKLPSQNDANSGHDAPEDWSLGIPIKSNSSINGTIGENLLEKDTNRMDEYDFYRYGSLPEGLLKIKIQVNPNEDGFYSKLRVFLGTGDGQSGRSPLKLGHMSFHVYDTKSSSVCLEPGDKYFIRLEYYGTNVSYTMISTFVEEQPEECPVPATASFPVVSTIFSLLSIYLILRIVHRKSTSS